jgi:hypothetical protein
VTTATLNGHKYELVIGDYTWWEAKADAESRGGHIATISTEEEFNLCAKLGADSGMVFLWLDAYVNSVEDWSSASWLTGESMNYVAWYPGEPSGGDEAYLAMFSVNGTWYYNDTANVVTSYSGKRGYILEIDG